MAAAVAAALGVAACATPRQGGATALPSTRAAATPAGTATPGPIAIATPTAAAPPAPGPTPEPAPTSAPAATPAPALAVVVVSADYGFLSVSTAPGAGCVASATLSDGTVVAGLTGTRVADGAGRVTWTYLQVRARAPRGTYSVDCAVGSVHATATAGFEVGN
jgi:hypothetical protein